MKLNFFAVLCVILINTLCILSSPINKRSLIAEVKCKIQGGAQYRNKWLCCNFDCMKEKYSGCSAACFASRTFGDHQGHGPNNQPACARC
ncbi:hypothetical protein U3516DRAFT_750834 [Neocallimastix sp. 'constans']